MTGRQTARLLCTLFALTLLAMAPSCDESETAPSGDNTDTSLPDRARRDLGTTQDGSTSDDSDAAGSDDSDAAGAPDAGSNQLTDLTQDPSGGEVGLNDLCPEAAKDIYLVDGNEQALYRFDPEAVEFIRLLTLDCGNSAFFTPHSMAVTREAEPYILYQDSSIWHIDAGGVCSQTSFQAGLLSEWSLFGMGFAMNSRDSADDTLFVANGNRLGSLNLTSFTVSDVGPLTDGTPELTGTAWGELWGFFPQSSPPMIAQIDKDTGEILTRYELSLSPDANAWAFAFWGGHFYIFYKSFTDASTNVYRMPVEGGDLELVAEDTGLYVVGAGVSTCAPVKWPTD